MADIQLQQSDYELFVLKSDYSDSLQLKQEPDGWNEETIKLTRHKDYHGIFISYTGQLKFFDDAKDYIEQPYILGGINATLRLTRYLLKDKDGDVKWVEDYSLIADYSTMKIVGNSLEINFNSNELEELMKSHESDTFEIERVLSIDNERIERLELYKIQLSGRALSGVGENVLNKSINKETVNGIDYQKIIARRNNWPGAATAYLDKIGDAGGRHSGVVSSSADDVIDSGKMFFVPTTDTNASELNVVIDYDVDFLMQPDIGSGQVRVLMEVWSWDGDATYTYVPGKSYELFLTDYINTTNDGYHQHAFSGTKSISLEYNEGIMIAYRMQPLGNALGVSLLFSKHGLKVSSDSFFEASPDISFSFIHDIVDRLMYIITGEQGRFYSRYFGRQELNNIGDFDYDEDGECGLIGALSGFWARAFNPQSEKYKSLQISLKDAITSLQAVFAIGVTIETHNLKQRLRFEKLEHFYRNEVVIRLPNQINNVVRTLDKELFFSGGDFGFEHGGNYDAQVGLDEPNTRTKTVTPIRKSDKKYSQLSKIRSDETGLELVRNKPQALFPDDDTGQDEHNWFLDLKRGALYGYEQKIWSDRLKELPSGIKFPENYKSMFFTPLRMMFRHGFVIRAGMEPYLDKLIMYANSEDNTNLKTHAKDDWNLGVDEAFKENDNILVSKLSRSRFTPNIIECEYSIDSDLMDWIKGTTNVLINGKYEDVPNVYFKFEWINEKEEIETGYLLDLTPGGKGKFKFQQANENII
jgi:hypothetical protein